MNHAQVGVFGQSHLSLYLGPKFNARSCKMC